MQFKFTLRKYCKNKQSLKETGDLKDSGRLSDFKPIIEYDTPNQHLYEFNGNILFNPDDIKLE